MVLDPDFSALRDSAYRVRAEVKPFLEKHELGEEDLESAAANAAMAIDGILEKHGKVGFWDDEDAQKQAVNEIDDRVLQGRTGMTRGVGEKTDI